MRTHAWIALLALGPATMAPGGCSGTSLTDSIDPEAQPDTVAASAATDGTSGKEGSADEVPSSLCGTVVPGVCRVHLAYGEQVEGIVEVEALSSTRLLVTDAPRTENGWTEPVEVLADGSLVMPSGVPSATCQSLLAQYAGRDLALKLEPVEGTHCDELSVALAWYFITEWFYFG